MTNESELPHVFLSYSRTDTNTMRHTRDRLREEGLAVWTDETGLDPGTPSWERAIALAIREAGAMVVLLSPEAAESLWVTREIAFAEERQLRIFPVLVRGDPLDAVPLRLTSYQRIDGRDDYEATLLELVESLCGHLGVEPLSIERARLAAEEEARQREEAERAAEEERQRLEAEARAAEEERQRLEAEARAAEEERKRAEAEERALERERRRVEAEELARRRREARGGAAPFPAWMWVAGAVVGVAVIIGVLALSGVFGGGTSQASEEPPADSAADTGAIEAPPPEAAGTPTPGPAAFQQALLGVAANGDWEPLIQEFDGVPMALAPAGCFMMGSENGDEDEQPVHEVCFDAPFWIDVYEVTNEQFGSGRLIYGDGQFTGDDQPRDSLVWGGAEAHCRSRSTRLPTEAEWEYAARGPDGLVYPWGARFDADNAVYAANASARTADVGSRPEGASWVGAYDMSGNVWEWVSDAYHTYFGDPQVNPVQLDGQGQVLRGGAYNDDDTNALRSANRYWEERGSASDQPTSENGFRCARDFAVADIPASIVAEVDTSTATPRPTATPHPTATPLPPGELPSPVTDVLANAEILYRDDFDALSQDIWYIGDTGALQASDGILALSGTSTDDAAYIGSTRSFRGGEGALVLFSYDADYWFSLNLVTGEDETSTYQRLIIDGAESTLYPGIHLNGNYYVQEFSGNIYAFSPGTWYYALYAIDEAGSYVLTIWERDNPSRTAAISGNNPEWVGLDWQFVAWVAEQSLYLDTYIELAFDSFR